MRDNASVSQEVSITLKRICSYWIQKSCFWAWIQSRYFESDLWLLSCFWAWIRSRYFESDLWLLSCFWAWFRCRYFESGLSLILFLSVNPKSLFRIRSVTLILFLSMNPKSLSRIGSESLIFFRAHIFEFRNQYRFSLVIRSNWVSETYSYSWYCLTVAGLH